jgi:hypothetical protein
MILTDDSGFSKLDDELTLMILEQLPLRDKLSAVIAVCKGWRSLVNTPALRLFTDLNLVLDLVSDLEYSTETFVEEVLSRYVSIPERTLVPIGQWLDNKGAETLVTDWLSDKMRKEVRCLAVGGMDVKREKAVINALPNLTSLTIASRRCNKEMLGMIQTKQAPSLQELHMMSVSNQHVTAEHLFNLIASAPKLTSLCIPYGICMTFSTLQRLKRAIAALRGGGGSSLIRTLQMQNTTIFAVCTLGNVFPELEYLGLTNMHGYLMPPPDPIQGSPDALLEVYDPPDNLTGMPRLHTFVHNYSDSHAKCLSSLLPKCPALKVFKLLQTEPCSYLLDSWKRTGAMPTPLAHLPAAVLSSLASGLQELSLRGVKLDANSVAGISLTHLEKLRVDFCGGAAAEATAILIKNNPSITSLDFGESLETYDILPWDGTSGEVDTASPGGGSRSATQQGIGGLSNLPARQLRSFRLRANVQSATPHPQLMDTIKQLLENGSFHNLECLEFSADCKVNANILGLTRSQCAFLPRLRQLRFAHTSKEDLSSYAHLNAPSLRRLEIVYVHERTHVSQTAKDAQNFLPLVSAALAKNTYIKNAFELHVVQAPGPRCFRAGHQKWRPTFSLRHVPPETAATLAAV